MIDIAFRAAILCDTPKRTVLLAAPEGGFQPQATAYPQKALDAWFAGTGRWLVYGAAAGLSFREIALRLGIKAHAVQNTTSCIKEKLYITSFRELETR